MEHIDTALSELAAGKYLLLTTFRRDGRAAPTPVWVMRDGQALAVWSAADAGKVKRIRNGGRVTVASCDWRGKPLGASMPGFAEVLAPDASAHFIDLMKRKYGLVARVGLLGSALRGGSERMAGIRIRLDG
ncbi:PPOX class F420-dependent oxidoreductase [Nocardia cyriacigeorgica]|uniref:PPOX class F420-dependent oxidoreductase n=1 Tax=Nocardia cyriacigeorgica TaxID=135487 RepID=A0ABX0CQW0_9NOCA|nr:PPOX class F420-dependent oxidoreductase [Nocardia cyriacigeorgica]NEW37861.1 PPOX class F420-dependent oxidoreductase [Nocardia cyriacigeorgica]NEW48755.1 PPOX class F420-dependent oxidoreductase [Nocardia cyriacigeorgica]NEW58257.1 PPOX class F420-dependent oxidoreductase [Nocardia cyriacigeorgica]